MPEPQVFAFVGYHVPSASCTHTHRPQCIQGEVLHFNCLHAGRHTYRLFWHKVFSESCGPSSSSSSRLDATLAVIHSTGPSQNRPPSVQTLADKDWGFKWKTCYGKSSWIWALISVLFLDGSCRTRTFFFLPPPPTPPWIITVLLLRIWLYLLSSTSSVLPLSSGWKGYPTARSYLKGGRCTLSPSSCIFTKTESRQKLLARGGVVLGVSGGWRGQSRFLCTSERLMSLLAWLGPL